MGTVPTIATYPAGGVFTSAYANTIKAAVDFLKNPPQVYGYGSVAQSLANNTQVAIALDTEVFDIVQSGDTPSHDNVTNNTRLVCRTAGKYEVVGQAQIASSTGGLRSATVRMNAAGSGAGGTLITTNQQSPLSGASTSVTTPAVIIPLTVGDYLELFALQSSGAAVNTVAGQGVTFLRMRWVAE